MTAPTVDAYVAELAHAVHGPGRVRRSILREVHDGLTDAAEAHESGGLTPAAAQAQAVAEFGTVDELAELYQAELTVRRGRATALFVALVFPGMVLGWALMWRAGVSWGPVPDDEVLHTMRSLSDILDSTALAAAGLAAVLFGLTFVRAIPARLITVASGAVAGVGSLTTGGISFWMNVIGGKAAGVALAMPGPAIAAYSVSLAVLVASLVVSGRTLRTATA